ncbi:hypothetical protein [Miniphocaeibacter massiliensis]|uniref:hypothetical protein n=1 Tax=Miniphocaeibacter massiliensis TaxID=2041841 RepID=UPI000C071067|nr:hypothetical protein [Miniphocaeibacter massiliensis]
MRKVKSSLILVLTCSVIGALIYFLMTSLSEKAESKSLTNIINITFLVIMFAFLAVVLTYSMANAFLII